MGLSFYRSVRILPGLCLIALGCARMEAVTECHAMGIQYGYYSGRGAACVNSKLNPAFQEEVNAFSRQACARARAINSFDPEDACKQASIEAENAAWHALANQPAGGSPPAFRIDTLMPGFDVRYGTPDFQTSATGPGN